MSNQRFRPNSFERPTGRVPVTRPVGRQEPQQSQPQQQQQPINNQQPTHSYEEEQQNTSRLTMPPSLGFEEDFEEEEKVKNSSNKLKFILFGIAGVVVLGLLIFAGMKFMGDKGTPTIDGSPLTNGQNVDQIGEGMKSPEGGSDTTVDFDGNPIPVKWPADVQPTRMELQLDPNTGDPVLLLVGDKSGLGTVIRSYDQSGKLSGHWVIVPDEDNGGKKEEPSTNEEDNEENTDGDSESEEDQQ